MNKQKYKAEATSLDTVINIGKSGIENVVEELEKQLKARKMVKVKFLRSALADENKKDMAVKLAELTSSELIEVRGNTAVFRRKR